MIYKMRQDLDNYKFYILKEYNEEFFEFSKTGLGKFPNGIELTLFEGKTKKEKSLKSDFNISRFYIFSIFINNEIKNILEKDIKHLEFFKVNTNDQCDFFYLNTKVIVNELVFTDIKDVILNEKYKFNNINSLNETFIFRDKNIPYEIFFTEKFIEKYYCFLNGIIFQRIENI